MTKTLATDRFCIGKDFMRANGSTSWGVFDNETKKFVEGGFFNKSAAREAAAQRNAEDRKAVR